MPPSRPTATAVELRMACNAAVVVLALSAPAVAIAALVAGRPGALGAAVAAALVLVLFVLSGVLLALAAPRGPAALLAAALGGFLLRLVLYAALVALVEPLQVVHGPSLAISAAVLLLVALAWEVRHVLRDPRFFWLDAAASSPRPLPVLPTERTSA